MTQGVVNNCPSALRISNTMPGRSISRQRCHSSIEIQSLTGVPYQTKAKSSWCRLPKLTLSSVTVFWASNDISVLVPT
jgi:hypothetical protein